MAKKAVANPKAIPYFPNQTVWVKDDNAKTGYGEGKVVEIITRAKMGENGPTEETRVKIKYKIHHKNPSYNWEPVVRRQLTLLVDQAPKRILIDQDAVKIMVMDEEIINMRKRITELFSLIKRLTENAENEIARKKQEIDDIGDQINKKKAERELAASVKNIPLPPDPPKTDFKVKPNSLGRMNRIDV